MTYTVVKEKLHEYIEQADKKKVKAIYALLEEDIEHGYSRAMYDDETIQVLEKISEDVKMRSFPFVVIYEVREHTVMVISVMNTHRKPLFL